MLDGTSNEYDLHSVYNGRGFIGVITDLSQVVLAIYDANIQPFTYTGSEDIDITNNPVSLNFPIKINDEIVLHQRNYNGAVFEMLSSTASFAFRQSTTHGGQPIATFNSSTNTCTLVGDCSIPKSYDKSSIDNLISHIYNDVYIKTDIATLFENI